MDQTRRKLILASSSIPMALVLPGCGGGGSSDQGQVAAGQEGERATAQSALPSTGGYVDIGNVSGKSIDAIFRSGGTEVLRYFVPFSNTLRTQGVLNSGAGTSTAFVRMVEVVTTGTSPSVTHHRCLSLELPRFPAVGGAQQYDATNGYKGTLVVNTTTATGTGASHYEYNLSTGAIKVTHNSAGLMTIEFLAIGSLTKDYVDGAPATSQTFSTNPPQTLALKAGSNLGVNPFQLTTLTNRGITVSYVTEDGSWI